MIEPALAPGVLLHAADPGSFMAIKGNLGVTTPVSGLWGGGEVPLCPVGSPRLPTSFWKGGGEG